MFSFLVLSISFSFGLNWKVSMLWILSWVYLDDLYMKVYFCCNFPLYLTYLNFTYLNFPIFLVFKNYWNSYSSSADFKFYCQQHGQKLASWPVWEGFPKPVKWQPKGVKFSLSLSLYLSLSFFPPPFLSLSLCYFLFDFSSNPAGLYFMSNGIKFQTFDEFLGTFVVCYLENFPSSWNARMALQVPTWIWRKWNIRVTFI